MSTRLGHVSPSTALIGGEPRLTEKQLNDSKCFTPISVQEARELLQNPSSNVEDLFATVIHDNGRASNYQVKNMEQFKTTERAQVLPFVKKIEWFLQAQRRAV